MKLEGTTFPEFQTEDYVIKFDYDRLVYGLCFYEYTMQVNKEVSEEKKKELLEEIKEYTKSFNWYVEFVNTDNEITFSNIDYLRKNHEASVIYDKVKNEEDNKYNFNNCKSV